VRFLPGAVLLFLGITAGTGHSHGRQNALYSPEEWESITVTRFASQVVPGTRYTAVATTGGLLLYDHLRRRWRNPLTPADGLPAGAIERIGIGSDGTIVVVTGSEEVRVDPSTGYLRSDRFPEMAPPPSPSLPTNLFSDPGYLYLGDGRIRGPLNVVAPVTDIRAGEGSDVWMTTWGLGLGYADMRTLQLEMMPHGLWSGDVRALVVTDDMLIAGGPGDFRSTGGVTEWRMAGDTWEYVLADETMGLLSDRVVDLALDGPEVWMAIDAGVARREQSGRWRTWTERDGLPDHRTTSITVGCGAVWLGTLRGAVAITGDSLTGVPLPWEAVVRDMAAGEGAVWFATESGSWGYRGTWPDGTLFRLRHPDGRLDATVDVVGTWGDEVWWAGSRGMVAYDSGSGEWLPVPEVGPLLPGEATSLTLDDANVWLTTIRGVWRLIRDSGQWYHYDESDGLLDSRVWCSALTGNTIWFGTRAGITRFDFSLRRKTP